MPSEESMIEDLREIEKNFREQGEYRKANTIDLYIRHNTHCKIPKREIQEKINQLREIHEERDFTSKESYYLDCYNELLKEN